MVTKIGTLQQRNDCARFARNSRATFPALLGRWTRREWNMQVQVAVQNRLARMVLQTKRDKQLAEQFAGPQPFDVAS